jgi:hypothetical protein
MIVPTPISTIEETFMQKRVLNFAAWLLLVAGAVLAFGGFNGPGKDLSVFLSVCILACSAIILFKLGGYSCTKNSCPKLGDGGYLHVRIPNQGFKT